MTALEVDLPCGLTTRPSAFSTRKEAPGSLARQLEGRVRTFISNIKQRRNQERAVGQVPPAGHDASMMVQQLVPSAAKDHDAGIRNPIASLPAAVAAANHGARSRSFSATQYSAADSSPVVARQRVQLAAEPLDYTEDATGHLDKRYQAAATAAHADLSHQSYLCPQQQQAPPRHLASAEATWGRQAGIRGGDGGGGGAGDGSPAYAMEMGLPSPMAPHDAAHAAYALIRCLEFAGPTSPGGGAPAAPFASSSHAMAAPLARQQPQQQPPWTRELQVSLASGRGADTTASSPYPVSCASSSFASTATAATDGNRQRLQQQQPRQDAAADAARWLLGSSNGGRGGGSHSGGGGGWRGGVLHASGSSAVAAAGFNDDGLQQTPSPATSSPLLFSSSDRKPSLQQQILQAHQQQVEGANELRGAGTAGGKQLQQGRMSLASVLAAASGPRPNASIHQQPQLSPSAPPAVALVGSPVSGSASSGHATPSPAAALPFFTRQQSSKPSAFTAATALPAKLKRFMRSARATLSPASHASVTTTISGTAPSRLGPASAAARGRQAAYTPPEAAPQQPQQPQALPAQRPAELQTPPALPMTAASQATTAAGGRAPAPTPLVASLRAQAAAAATARASDLMPQAASAVAAAAWETEGAMDALAALAAAQAAPAVPASAVSAAATTATAAGGGPSRPALMLCVGAALPQGMARERWSLDDYSIERRLSKGASSAVYKATCKHSGLDVALKVYFLELLPDAVKHMVVRELEIHSSAVHPNIVQLYAAFETEKHVVLVMEYASRGDLYGIQRATAEHPFGRRQDEGRVVSVVLRPLLAALAFLHSRGICHRDIKPENVLFTSNWQLKLADFGVSIDLARERAVTRAGTACYMAPEVVRCPLKHRPEDNKNDPRLAYGTACDIWAVGVLAYELLVGFTPLSVARTPTDSCFNDGLCSVTLSQTGTTGDGGEGAAYGGSANAGGGGGGGGGGDRVALMFPGSASTACRSFVSWCLAPRPEERPTALQLWHHAWVLPPSMAAYAAVDAEL